MDARGGERIAGVAGMGSGFCHGVHSFYIYSVLGLWRLFSERWQLLFL